jgi:hypothetical protein
MIIHCIDFFKWQKKIQRFLRGLISENTRETDNTKSHNDIWEIWNERIQSSGPKTCEIYIHGAPIILNSEIIDRILETIGVRHFHTVQNTIHKMSVESILPSSVVLRFGNLFVPCSHIYIDCLDQSFQYVVRFVSEYGTFVLTVDPLSNSYTLHDYTSFASFTPQKEHTIVDLTQCFDLVNDIIISDIGVQLLKIFGKSSYTKIISNLPVLNPAMLSSTSLQCNLMYGFFSSLNPIESILSIYYKAFAKFNNNEYPGNINGFSKMVNCAYNTLVGNLIYLNDKVLHKLMPNKAEEISGAIVECDYAFGLKNKMSAERIQNTHSLLYSIIKMHSLIKLGVFKNECYSFDNEPIFINIDTDGKKETHKFYLVSNLLSNILSTVRSNFVVKKSEHFISLSTVLPEPVFCKITDKYINVQFVIVDILHSGNYMLTLGNENKRLSIWFHTCEDIYVMNKNFDGWQEYDNSSEIWEIELPQNYEIPKNEWSNFLLSILPLSFNVISNLPVVSQDLCLPKLYLDKGFVSDYDWTNDLLSYENTNDLSAFRNVKETYKKLKLNLSFDELYAIAKIAILFDLWNNNTVSNTNEIVNARNILKSSTLPEKELKIFFLHILLIQRMLQDYRVV